MHFAVIAGRRESVGDTAEATTQLKFLGVFLLKCNLQFRLNSLLSQESGNLTREKSRYFPFFILRETVPISYPDHPSPIIKRMLDQVCS